MHGSETPRGKPVALKTDRAVYRSCERELPRRKAVASTSILQEALQLVVGFDGNKLRCKLNLADL